MKLWEKFLSLFKKKKDCGEKNCCGDSPCSKEKEVEEVEEKTCCKDACKHSLHIGINDYPGSANDLRGCVNDANNWARLLKEDFGFQPTVLTNREATLKNVVKEMRKIIAKAKSADYVVITFSGHGTNIRDVSGDEDDRRDEALCLYDRLLVDDSIRKLFDGLPEGVRFTFISDSCHSGTVTRSFLNTLYNDDAPRARYLPPSDDEEAFEVAPKSVSKKVLHVEGINEVLLTGCKSTEYSYDARLGGQYQGAMSANAIRTLRDNPEITYYQFHKILRSKLPSRKFPQSPQLEGNEENLSRRMFM